MRVRTSLWTIAIVTGAIGIVCSANHVMAEAPVGSDISASGIPGATDQPEAFSAGRPSSGNQVSASYSALDYVDADVAADYAVPAYVDPNALPPSELPSPRACTDIVYSQIGDSGFVTAAGPNLDIAYGDEIILAGTQRQICSVDVTMGTTGANTIPYSLELRIYATCPANNGPAGPCGQNGAMLLHSQTVTNIPAAGGLVHYDVPFVTVPNTIHVVFVPSGNNGHVSPVFADDPIEVGDSTPLVTRCNSTSANNGCNRNFGNSNDFIITIKAGTNSTTGACCNHVTGACDPNGTVASCTGANEILYLGQTCAEVNCPTGGCNPNPCPATLCPSGAHVNETETCGQNTNGCDTPQDIACGDTVCGTAWRRDGTMQDVDWYRFTTSGPAIVRLTATAEFPVQVSLVNIGASSCGTPTVIGSATANACTPAVFTSSCFSNSTELYARITVNGGVNLCGCNNDYTLKVECLPCTGSCCAIPGTGSCYKNCLNGLTESECTALGNQWIWGLNSTCFAATNGDQCGLVRTDVDCCKGDLNGDGTVNGLDIREFLKLFLSIETCFDNPDKFCRADYNNDNQITIADIGTSSTRFVKDLLDTKICYVQCSSTCGSPPANSGHERFEQPCGPDGNGGCNLTPALFEPLPTWPFGTTISFCGSTNTFDTDPSTPAPESRDADWWGTFTLNQAAVITLNIKSADPNGVGTFLIKMGAGGSCTGAASVGGVAFTTACSTAAASTDVLVSAGTYVIFVGNMTSTGAFPTLHSPCGPTNGYTVTATSVAAPMGACCSISQVCLGTLNQIDCAAQSGIFHAASSCPGFSCPQIEQCNMVAYDNGIADGVNGSRPTAGWTTSGQIDDFTLTAGNTAFSCIRIDEIHDPGAALDPMQISIYNLPATGIPGLGTYPDLPNRFSQNTYMLSGTAGVNRQQIVDSGIDYFGRDLLLHFADGPSINPGAGHKGLNLRFPGIAAQSFWATSTPPVPASSADFMAVWADGGLPGATTTLNMAFNLKHN